MTLITPHEAVTLMLVLAILALAVYCSTRQGGGKVT